MQKLFLLSKILVLNFIFTISVFAKNTPEKNIELNFNQKNIEAAINAFWKDYYLGNLNKNGVISNSFAETFGWRGSVAVMMFTHAYSVFHNLKYLEYAEKAYLVSHPQWSDDLLWAANSAYEIMESIKHAPPSYKSIRPIEYYEQDIKDIYHAVTMPKGQMIEGHTKQYNTFLINFMSDDKKYYSTFMWSVNPNFGIADPQFNTCSLGQAIVLSYLMSNESVFDDFHPIFQGNEWLKTQVNYLINHEEGIVYDHIKLNDPTNEKPYFTFKHLDTREYTYNTSTVLAALALNEHFASASKILSYDRLKLYQNIVKRIQDQFTDNMILSERDKNPEFYYDQIYGGDHSAFKGVFMHFLPYFYYSPVVQSHKGQTLKNDLKTLVSNSANAVWKQLKDNNNKVSYNWSIFTSYQSNAVTTTSGLEALITAWEFNK